MPRDYTNILNVVFSVYASTILRKAQWFLTVSAKCILQTVHLYFQMFLSSEFLNPARQGGGGGGGLHHNHSHLRAKTSSTKSRSLT